MVWVWKKQLLKSRRQVWWDPPGVAVGAQVTKAVAQLPSKEAAPVNRRPLEAAQNQGWLWVDKMVAQLWKVPGSPGEHLPTLSVQHPLLAWSQKTIRFQTWGTWGKNWASKIFEFSPMTPVRQQATSKWS